jgi:hypothetical protein
MGKEFEIYRPKTEKIDMPLSMVTVKTDGACSDQFRLLAAWEAWGIPLEQQLKWFGELYGPQGLEDIKDLVAYDAALAKK